MKRTIVSRGALALALGILLLAGAAGSAGATTTLSPASADFGDRQVGTTSPGQAFTLNVRCAVWSDGVPPLIPPSCLFPGQFAPQIGLDPAGEFTQTNDCPPLIFDATELGTNCTIDVAFAPTSVGLKQSALTTGPLGPTAELSGNGVTAQTPPSPPTPGPGPDPPPGNGSPAPGTDPVTGLALNLGARRQKLRKRITLRAIVRELAAARAAATEPITLVVGGKAVRRTRVELPLGKRTRVRVPIKRAARKRLAKRLKRKGKARTRVRAAAIDAGGLTGQARTRVRFRRR